MIPHHVVTGPEDAPALVLSNSLGTTLELWDPQAEALAEHFRLVRYDTRGHGRSQTPHGPYSIEEVGGDVVDLLDHLGIEKAHFAGVSLGGMTGMWLGIFEPLRVHKLVLLCTSPLMGPPRMWVERMAAVRAGGTQAIAAGTMERWLTESYRAAHDISWLVEMFEGIEDEGYIHCCAIIARMDLTANLGQVRAPTLIIAGAQDPATPPEQHAARIHGAIAHSRLEVLDPGAHLINVERPDDVTRLILEHLEA
jgi:3-oxoadipate enol-lactonase